MNAQRGDVALARVFRVVNGGTPTAAPEHWDGPIPWATPMDLAPVDGGLLGRTSRTLTPTGLSQGSAMVPEGSILVSTRAPIGYVAMVDKATAFNQGCRGLVPRERVDSRYFAYQLQARRPILESMGQGSTFVELSSTALAAFRLRKPELDEQRRIADFLDAETARIDALIAKKRRMIGLLDERLVAVRDGALAGVGGDLTHLGRFVKGLQQGDSPVASSEPATVDEWGVLKLSCVRRGAFVPTENKALSARPRRPLVPDVGDILITRSNTPQLVGDACLVEEPAPRRMLCDLIYRVRLDQRRLDPAYATEALLTTASRGFLSSVARGTSGSMVKLRGEDVCAVPLRVPTLEEQRRVVATIRRISRSVDHTTRALTRQIELLQERRQALITAAVTGQLPVPA